MPARSSQSNGVNSSPGAIEARATRRTSNANANADMDADADADADGEADPDVDADGDADAEGEVDLDATGANAAAGGPSETGGRSKKDLLHLIEVTAQDLSSYEEGGLEIATGFQRIPNKRLLPDYFDVIKEPTAFSTIRGKVQKRVYNAFSEFVRDAALICHNAQVYNRPSAPIFQDALRLREVLKEKLEQMVRDGTITAAEAELPDLGEIPDSPDVQGADGDGGVGGFDEEEDDSDTELSSGTDSSDQYDPEERGPNGEQIRERRRLLSGKPPPRLVTPVEARVKAVIEGLRDFDEDEDGEPLLDYFERLPEREWNPEYYLMIKQPIQVKDIRRKARQQQYATVDDAVADFELMWRNAKTFNQRRSPNYNAAVALQKECKKLVAQQRAKPDHAFRDKHGRLALPAVQHMGQVWRPGDWVLLRNANDPGKPIVAQLFSTWIDAAGLAWVRAGWYYRPEQTVHRFDKHFYENEVFKTDRYGVHSVGDVLDRCLVQHAPEYARGRPRGLPPTMPVFVCAARYHETTGRFTRIRKWKLCLPAEVRKLDYALDLFPTPRPLVKVMTSPIKHLLRDDARESDALPKPTAGHPNAPPIIGAVHRRRRAAGESPPPDPALIASYRQQSHPGSVPGLPPSSVATPSPHASYAQQQFVPRPPSMSIPMVVGSAGARPGMPPQQQQQQPLPPHIMQPLAASQVPGAVPPGASPHFVSPQPQQQQALRNGSISSNGTGNGSVLHNPAMTPQPQQQQQPLPPQQPQQPQQPQLVLPPQPPHQHLGYPPQLSFPPQQQQQHHQQQPRPMATPNAPPSAAGRRVSQAPHVSAIVPPPVPTGYVPPRATAEAYVLPADVEAKIPEDVRSHFHRDTEGRVLFFTAPSVGHAATTDKDQTAPGAGVGVAPACQSLGHSVRYLNGLDEFRAERQRKRKERDEQLAQEAEQAAAARAQQHQAAQQQLYGAAGEALGGFVQWMNAGTEQLLEGEGAAAEK